MIHLVLGGARSGKSRFAEADTLRQAQCLNKQPVYIATATAIDGEMVRRIAKHQEDRGDSWQLKECPLALAELIEELSSHDSVYLVDCLTLWLNNQLYRLESDKLSKGELERQLSSGIERLCLALENAKANITLVSNEVGLGVIPMGETSRLFVDYCGWLNQAVAKVADKVTLVTAGIPLVIKESERNKGEAGG